MFTSSIFKIFLQLSYLLFSPVKLYVQSVNSMEVGTCESTQSSSYICCIYLWVPGLLSLDYLISDRYIHSTLIPSPLFALFNHCFIRLAIIIIPKRDDNVVIKLSFWLIGCKSPNHGGHQRGCLSDDRRGHGHSNVSGGRKNVLNNCYIRGWREEWVLSFRGWEMDVDS